MQNPKCIFIAVFTGVLLLSVTGNCDAKLHPINNQDKFLKYYYFYYDCSNNQEILKSLLIGLPNGTAVEVVIDSLLKYLSDNYFHECYYLKGATNIKLNLIKIDSVRTKFRDYKIATINVVDTNKICMGCFFQGSLGAYMTYIMLAVNILQPQFAYTSSFLDGVIFLYNGSPLTGMDHIDIDGIFIPKTFYMNACDAINKSN